MPDNYAVLTGKYQRALISIRELEQERDQAKREAEEKQKDFALLEKNMRYLCETIEKKNQVKKPEGGDSRNDKEKMWAKIKTIDLIRQAQETLENYFPSLEKNINQLFQIIQEKTKKIENLEAQVEEMKRVNKDVLKKVSEQAANGTDNKNLQKILKAGTNTEAVNINLDPSGDVQFGCEDDDSIEDTVAEAIDVLSQGGEILKQIPKGPKVVLNHQAKESIQKKTKESLLEKANQIGEKAGNLTNVQKYLVQALGDTGYSEAAPIINETREKHQDVPSDSRIRSAIYDLLKTKENQRVIESIQCSVPGMPHLMLYRLTDLGREIYTYLYNKEAAEAEMDVIRKNHSTLEHGYGIRQTAFLIMQSSYVSKDDEIIYLTRAKEHSVMLGNNLSYIPDIVIKQNRGGKEKIFYIEYETGKSADEDFFKKCNKISSFSRFINIIVPNNDAKTETIAKIEKWRNKVQDGTFNLQSNVKFMLSTYSELKDGANETRFPWRWEKSVSPPRKKEGTP